MAPMDDDPSPDAACPIPRHPAPTARVRRLVRMTVERPDPAKARRFFADFGLTPTAPPTADTLHLGGADGERAIYTVRRGPRPRLLGLTFTADEDAIARLAALDEASDPPALDSEPTGSARRIRLAGPMGLWIDVVARAPSGQNETLNETGDETRRHPRLNQPVRLAEQPPAVRHLGHVALEAVDFEGAVAWFTARLGLIPSDVQVLADGTPALVFLRCDRGPEPTEHHTLVIARSVEDGLNHAAFAVDDLDAVAMGQTVMRAAGWRHAWGVGRHLMGSQIFDYWYDPWGSLVEHYADSDRFDAAHPPGVMRMSRSSMAQWGPPMPSHFANARLTPRRLWAIARGLRREPSLTIQRLLLLKRALTE